MRDISCEEITRTVRDLCIQANCHLPVDVQEAIVKAEGSERSPVGKAILGDLEENFRFADARELPICQDTGMAVVFVELGQEVHITGGLLSDAVNAGVAQGYVEGHLRCSVVGDPLRRVNTNNNTPAIIHLTLVEGGPALHHRGPQGLRQREYDRPADAQALGGAGGGGGLHRGGRVQRREQSLPPHRSGRGRGRHLGDGRPAGQAGPSSARWTSTMRTPSTPGWRPKPSPASTPWASGPRAWAGPPPPCRCASSTTAPTSPGLPCAVNIGCHVTRHASAVL